MADPEGGVNFSKATELMAKLQEEANPLSFKACYPRRMTVPKGYSDPVALASVLVAHLSVVNERGLTELAHKTAYLTSMLLIKNRVPTYFVSDEFAQAVANTDLPGDFKFAELKWPFEAMAFVLSDAFCQSYYGRFSPFLAISRLKAGSYPEDLGKLPPLDSRTPHIVVEKDMVLLDYSYYGAELTVTYNGAYPMTDGVEIFKAAPWHDATPMEHIMYNTTAPKGSLEGEEETKYIELAQQLLIKLLLTTAEMPAQVEHSKITRHAITTPQGTTKLPQLWSPGLLGRTYRIPRKYSTQPGRTGVKPRFKYRRGHYTWQAKRFKNQEFTSVDAMPKTPQGYVDFTAAGEELAGKFYACHERLWIEGFFRDEEDEKEK